MGVHGLWKLLDASGKPVPLESLEGKILAIDISIWMYQVLQGYQDRHGASRPNAHLLGLFNRLCKLLYYKIKPVFVFDGGVPMLKKNTIASRRKQKSIAISKAQKMKADLINNLIKHNIVKTVLNKDSVDQNNRATQIAINLQTKRPDEDMFILPDISSITSEQTYISNDENDSDTSVELSPRKHSKWMGNIHNVDVTRNEFKMLPADVRYDILTDLKETRKQNSWGRLHEMPEESQEFSGFQLKRLLKRRYVQESLESAEKEMGGKTLTLEELDKLLTEQGINTKANDVAFRIAADSSTRLIYISDKNKLAKSSVNNVSEADEDGILKNVNEEVEPVAGPSNPAPIVENMNEYELNDDIDDDIDVPTYDNSLSIMENINEYTFDSDTESDSNVNESLALLAKKYLGNSRTNPALTYMLEYSGLSQNQIVDLIKHNKNEKYKTSSKSIKAPEKDIYSELTEDSNSMDNKLAQIFENYEEVSKSVTQLQNMQDSCTDNNSATIELSPSSPELDNSIKVKSLEDNAETYVTATSNITSSDNGIILEKHISDTKSDDITQVDTSDSDSDDFIEIQDVPIPDMNVPKGIMKKKNITITFKSNEKLDDDIFADIFEEANKNGITPMSDSEKKQSVNTNGEHGTLLISENSLKSSLLDTISEEPITEITETESLENTQLKDNISNDEGKVHDSQASNEPIEQNNTGSFTQVNPLNECVQEKPAPLPTNEEDLLVLKQQLEDEQEELAKDIGKLDRQGINISDQIRIEVQELLRLFGIPYIIAPMEAEAQCAYLEQIKLTDGTVTDDSDIWLFGGQCVYKNFFNHNKSVLQFRACDIQNKFKLSRNQLIELALLVGSDYTVGVPGIGPVTALEILAAFPAKGDNVLHGLHNFCSWIKKGRIAAPGKTGLRNKLRNVKLDKDFPSQAVVQAYLFPTVDESKETFTWGKPNLVLLGDYTRQKFGWTKDKFDDTMIPVLRRMKENKNQKLLDMYFKAKASLQPIELSLSKRVQKALCRLNNCDVAEENVDGKSRPKKGKKSDDIQKLNKGENTIELKESTNESKPLIKINTTLDKPIKPIIQKEYIKECIPQREKDKACALQRKLHAIEVFRKSKHGLDKRKKVKCAVRKIKKEAELSESDSN